MSTEIYLCHARSCRGIEDGNARTGRWRITRTPGGCSAGPARRRCSPAGVVTTHGAAALSLAQRHPHAEQPISGSSPAEQYQPSTTSLAAVYRVLAACESRRWSTGRSSAARCSSPPARGRPLPRCLRSCWLRSSAAGPTPPTGCLRRSQARSRSAVRAAAAAAATAPAPAMLPPPCAISCIGDGLDINAHPRSIIIIIIVVVVVVVVVVVTHSPSSSSAAAGWQSDGAEGSDRWAGGDLAEDSWERHRQAATAVAADCCAVAGASRSLAVLGAAMPRAAGGQAGDSWQELEAVCLMCDPALSDPLLPLPLSTLSVVCQSSVFSRTLTLPAAASFGAPARPPTRLCVSRQFRSYLVAAGPGSPGHPAPPCRSDRASRSGGRIGGRVRRAAARGETSPPAPPTSPVCY
jgi:hypothetical protein